MPDSFCQYTIQAAEPTNPTHLVKNILEFILGQSGAFDIFDGAQFLGHPVSIFLTNGLHLLPRKLFAHSRIVAQISLGAHD